MTQKLESPAGWVPSGALECQAGKLDTPKHRANSRAMQRAAPPPASAISERKRQPGETADDYPHVVAQLSDGWRVIRCAGDIQWILQRRDAGKSRVVGWRGVAYCMSQKALMRLCGASCGPIDPSAWSVLVALPAHFPGAPQ